MRKPKSPESRHDIAARLRWLSEQMADVAVSMDYYGGFGPMAKHVAEMMGASMICLQWAHEIEAESDVTATAEENAGIERR